MKIWLDDIRPAPRGWKRTKTVDDTIRLIARGDAREVSLDYDLDETDGRRKGVEVLEWISENVDSGRMLRVPVLHVHTANPYGGHLMAGWIQHIEGLDI